MDQLGFDFRATHKVFVMISRGADADQFKPQVEHLNGLSSTFCRNPRKPRNKPEVAAGTAAGLRNQL